MALLLTTSCHFIWGVELFAGSCHSADSWHCRHYGRHTAAADRLLHSARFATMFSADGGPVAAVEAPFEPADEQTSATSSRRHPSRALLQLEEAGTVPSAQASTLGTLKAEQGIHTACLHISDAQFSVCLLSGRRVAKPRGFEKKFVSWLSRSLSGVAAFSRSMKRSPLQ